MVHKYKKLLLLIFLLLLKIDVFSKTYLFENIEWVSVFTELYSFKDGVFLKKVCDFEENWSETRGFYKIYEENSYTVAEVKFKNYTSKMFLFFADERHLIIYDTHSNEQITCTNSKYNIDEAYIWAIDECTATSYLTGIIRGNPVLYKPENLANNDITKKWVEGNSGNGEGEVLRIKNDLTHPRTLYLINGFFDPQKTYLFYENTRIKTCLIRCYDENHILRETFVHDFLDTGNLQLIHFQQKYAYFDFEVKSVYPGSKYNDTAVSAIMVDGLSS